MLSLTPTTASLLGRLITPLTKRSEDAESTPEPLTQVVNSSFITTDFHALQFDAASSLQILPLFEPKYFRSWDKYLVTSPYNSSNHLLDLTRLALQDRIFTLALTVLRPIREDYATAPYEDSFNWSDVLEVVRRLSDKVGITWTTRDFYTVIFRSKVRKDCDEKLLTDLDIHSHEEAVVSGGLLRYWFGTRNAERQNLATCVWRNREDARAGGSGPWHLKARASGAKLYDEIRFSAWNMTIHEGAKNWSLEELKIHGRG